MSRLRVLLLGASLAVAVPVAAHPALDAQIRRLSEEISRRPGDAALLLARAQVLAEHSELEAARRDLAAAVAADAEMPAPHLALAEVELRDGRPERSLAAATRFLEMLPGHGRGLLVRARAATALSDERRAAWWREALGALEAEGRPQPEIALEAATILGIDPIDRAIARLGPVPTLIAAGIELELGEGDLEAALERCREARRVAPSPEWSVREGEILASAGRIEESHAACRRALEEIAALPERARDSRFVGELAGRARAGLGP